MMKYMVYNETTGEIADIISTILEDRPMKMPKPDPFGKYDDDVCWDNCQVKDENKATRALNIFIRNLGFYPNGWCIKEIINE